MEGELRLSKNEILHAKINVGTIINDKVHPCCFVAQKLAARIGCCTGTRVKRKKQISLVIFSENFGAHK